MNMTAPSATSLPVAPKSAPPALNLLDHHLHLLGLMPVDADWVAQYKAQMREQMSHWAGLWLKDRGWGGTVRAIGRILILLAILGALFGRNHPEIFIPLGAVILFSLLALNQVNDLEQRVVEWERLPLFIPNYALLFPALLVRLGNTRIPEPVMDIALELHSRVPDAVCYVEVLKEDPIFLIRYDAREYPIAVWDETGIIAGLESMRGIAHR